MIQYLRSFPRSFIIFLISVSLISIGIALYATLPIGAGVSGDAARNLSTAENILQGRGFYDYSRSPFVWWPPLYPLLLAGISKLTHSDVFVIAWFLNVILAGINIWLAGILLFRIFQNTYWTYLGILMIAASFGMLKISTNVASDPLFITFVLAFLIYFGSWDGKMGWGFVLLCVLAALASLQRLLGVTLIASAGVCIVLIKGEKLKDRLKAALIFSIIAIVPLLTWIIGHNYMKHQTIFGPRDYARLPWNNLIDSTEKVLNWFYPFYTVQGILPYLNLAGIGMIVITLIVLNKKSDWLAWGRTLSGPFVLPGAVFLVVYALVLSFTVNYAEHKYPGYDRFEIVILPVMLPLIFITLQKLIQPKSRVVNGVLSILFILSFGYAVQGSYEYVTASHGNGVVEYNMYNFPPIQDSPTTQKMKELALANPEAALYSNNPAVIWFVTRREVLMPPLWEKKRKFDESAKQQLKGWPGEDGYLAWFIPDIYEIFATPEELSRVANVELIYRTPNGEIYSVRSIGD